MNIIIDKINKEQCKKTVPSFKVGDTVKVGVKIVEGENERLQSFTGLVIARKGKGKGIETDNGRGCRIQDTFTLRRVAYGQGMERVFPIHSPRVDTIEVVRRGRVRRAKLYYLRGKKGKDAKVKEQLYEPKATVAAQ